MWTEWFRTLVGPDAPQAPLSLAQMSLRAAIVYVAGLFIVRVGKNRLLGRNTAFDIILGFILGSLFSRAINGTAPLLETLGAALVLVTLHWIFASFAFRNDRFDELVKGRRSILVRDGQLQWENLRKDEISESDLLEALRLSAHVDDPSRVRAAWLERNGQISILLRGRDSLEGARAG